MTFTDAFANEMLKMGRRRRKSKLRSALSGALFGAGLGAVASSLASPFTYAGFRARSYGRKNALVATMLRLGERSAYGIPIGMVGGLGR